MKSVVLIASLLFVSTGAFAESSSINACPNLSGDFVCGPKADGDFRPRKHITQSQSNGVATYSFNGTKVVADGLTRLVSDASKSTYSASCVDSKLVVTQGEFNRDTYSIEADGKILIDGEFGLGKASDGSTQYQPAGSVECTRLQE